MAAQRPAPARPARAARSLLARGAAPAARGVPSRCTSHHPMGLCPHQPAPQRLVDQHLLQRFQQLRSRLSILNQREAPTLPGLAQAVGPTASSVRTSPPPEEQAEVGALRAAGLQTHIATFSRAEENFQLGQVIPNEVREAASGKVAP